MTYSGDPNTSPKDAVFFYLGGHDAEPFITDAEIQFVIVDSVDLTNGNSIAVAAECCSAIIAKAAGKVNVTADGVEIDAEALQTKYSALRQELLKTWRQRTTAGAAPYDGSSDPFCGPEQFQRPKNFGIGMGDNPLAGDEYPQLDRQNYPAGEPWI